MSHTPEQPHEIPFREVEHDVPSDEYFEGFEFIAGMGTVREWHWWGTASQDAKVRTELLARERRREQLGGFGFRGLT